MRGSSDKEFQGQRILVSGLEIEDGELDGLVKEWNYGDYVVLILRSVARIGSVAYLKIIHLRCDYCDEWGNDFLFSAYLLWKNTNFKGNYQTVSVSTFSVVVTNRKGFFAMTRGLHVRRPDCRDIRNTEQL